MGNRSRFAVASAALAAVLSFLLGCGTSPTAPANLGGGGTVIQGGNQSPPILKVNSDGTVSYVSVPRANLSGSTGAQAASAKIDGNKGGKVTCGRFSVIVPSGAFIGPATITISVADPSVLVCDLSITPQAANRFKVPVQLVTDLKDLTVSVPSQTTYWYDPVHDQWVNLTASTDSSSKTVTAYLNHFSIYGTGKAGW